MKKSIFLAVSLMTVMFVYSLGAVTSAKSSFVTLTGQILLDGVGSGVSGVTVTASNPIGGCSGHWTGDTSLTNGFGYFVMSVPNDCYFDITPSRSGYSFKPSSRQVTPANVGSLFEFAAIPD